MDAIFPKSPIIKTFIVLLSCLPLFANAQGVATAKIINKADKSISVINLSGNDCMVVSTPNYSFKTLDVGSGDTASIIGTCDFILSSEGGQIGEGQVEPYNIDYKNGKNQQFNVALKDNSQASHDQFEGTYTITNSE
ncbi:hypothetical protein [Facilibium subflavum]|uniref:hypothetical protein n=1 Tax=Facilibium subflavum TaxID=2219058 RepID=UPI000E65BBE2|nr:hypothetical protein [Facilibium subflavum]